MIDEIVSAMFKMSGLGLLLVSTFLLAGRVMAG